MRREQQSRHKRTVARTPASSRRMYSVEDVIAVQYKFRRFLWLVKWKGFPDPTWIPTRNFARRSYWRKKMEELKHNLSKGGSTRASSFESSPGRRRAGRVGGLNVKDVLDFKETEDGRQSCEVDVESVAGPVWLDVQDLSSCKPSVVRKVRRLKDAYESRHQKDEDDAATTPSVAASDSESARAATPNTRYGRKRADVAASRKRNGVEKWLEKWGGSGQGWRSPEFVEKFEGQLSEETDQVKSEEEVFTVEDVLGFKVRRTGEEYFRVKWVGYAASTWEPGKNLIDVTDRTLLDKIQRLRERRKSASGAGGRARQSRVPRKSVRPADRSGGRDTKPRERPRQRRSSRRLSRSA